MKKFIDRKYFHVLSRCFWVTVYTFIKFFKNVHFEVWASLFCFNVGVGDTVEKLSPVLLLLAINYHQ
jgi:hypothetical protein